MRILHYTCIKKRYNVKSLLITLFSFMIFAHVAREVTGASLLGYEEGGGGGGGHRNQRTHYISSCVSAGTVNKEARKFYWHHSNISDGH